jgi:tRNA A37 N6-isopentenylltransferase MiaA
LGLIDPGWKKGVVYLQQNQFTHEFLPLLLGGTVLYYIQLHDQPGFINLDLKLLRETSSSRSASKESAFKTTFEYTCNNAAAAQIS